VDQAELLRYTIDVLERLSIPYMLVGSLASTAYGEPRFTQDIDIVVDLPLDRVCDFCAAFPAPEFFIHEDAVRQAVQNQFQFNVLHPASANIIDMILPRADEWGRVQMERRQRIQLLADRSGFAARPEDVILGKMWYYAEGGSEKHLRDITGILRISGQVVDRDYAPAMGDKTGPDGNLAGGAQPTCGQILTQRLGGFGPSYSDGFMPVSTGPVTGSSSSGGAAGSACNSDRRITSSQDASQPMKCTSA